MSPLCLTQINQRPGAFKVRNNRLAVQVDHTRQSYDKKDGGHRRDPWALGVGDRYVLMLPLAKGAA